MGILKQQEADALIRASKEVKAEELPLIVRYQSKSLFVANSIDASTEFIITINHSKYDYGKITIQGRESLTNQVLIRIDVCNEINRHVNPDGRIIRGSHIHLYREGYGVKWAIPLHFENYDLMDICKTFFDIFCIINASVLTFVEWRL